MQRRSCRSSRFRPRRHRRRSQLDGDRVDGRQRQRRMLAQRIKHLSPEAALVGPRADAAAAPRALTDDDRARCALARRSRACGTSRTPIRYRQTTRSEAAHEVLDALPRLPRARARPSRAAHARWRRREPVQQGLAVSQHPSPRFAHDISYAVRACAKARATASPARFFSAAPQ